MTMYPNETKVLRRLITDIDVKLKECDESVILACVDCVNDMKALVDIIDGGGMKLNILSVTANFAEKLSIVINKIDGSETIPECVYNCLIDQYYTKACEEPTKEEE